MNCEICGKDVGDVIVLLNKKKPDGCLNTLACLACALKSDAYCKKHARPHLGFEDGTTACIPCIEETVSERATQEVEIFRRLQESLPEDEFARLIEAACLSSLVTGQPEARSVLRFIVTKAMRTKKGTQSVLDQIIRERSVDCVLG